MSQKTFNKCYFGCSCNDNDPLHKFPNPNSLKLEQIDRFKQWKSVLKPADQEKGDDYICKKIRICGRHFNKSYRLPSHYLTQNAVPTLFLGHSMNAEVDIYSDPTPGPSNLTDVVSDYVEPAPIYCTPEKRRSMSYMNTKNKIMDITTKRTIIRLKNSIEKLRKKYKHQKTLMQCAKQIAMKESFLKFAEKLPETSRLFTLLQIKGLKKPKGRRFSEKEKIMGLTIYKQSPKAYRLLQNMFVLPSKRAIQIMLSAVTIVPGINNIIISNLKNAVKNLNNESKLVNLLFDEVSLAPGLEYNIKLGKIIGFEDLGPTCRQSLADHALVLMIKSIKSKYKQPICYTFCTGSTKAPDLKKIIKQCILQLTEIGLTVVATICDQATTNTRVIKMLQAETREKYLRAGEEYNSGAFEVENIKVYPLFDTPHLLKGIRNNLLKKDAKFFQNGEVKWAKWEHLRMLLNVDTGDDEIRLVNKITESHVIESKIPKMKVKHAAQVFSQRVSAALRFLAKHEILPSECQQTADFLLIFDQLFDSFNGHSYQISSKKYKSCFKTNSPHIQLWNNLLPVLESIKFQSITHNNQGNVVKFESIPSIKNWINNIKTFKEMWVDLNTNHNVNSLLTRNFNQDPLENFFSSIRSNGIRNTNPSCNQFINAYKTLIINNFNSPHSLNANCEKDNNYLFQSLNHLINTPACTSSNDDFACEVDSLITVMGNIKSNVNNVVHDESKKYVTGYIIKKCKIKVFRNCEICMRDFCSSTINKQSFNYEIDYTKKSLFYPNKKFNELMNEIYYLIVACLRISPESLRLKDKMKFLLNCACDYNMITCDLHKSQLIEFINDLSIKLIIHSWCTNVNRILNGKITNFDKDDHIKLKAFNYFEKHKKNKK
ncbi:transposable element P transposase isoform X3 [Spodoptera frugiperda]|uniref:Transposable element P transposase isoform X2 n=1 Tax=Spodoptera frugiperda TaxID=7108 RepID=A0A9R0E2G9_SPOFR|nr:transposable element P transposase isoform X2 [Spodoptera frugiperda]XP_050557998.1 transposable element P transposase isoform X3 [Spodoptera frugiperda]